MAHASFPFLSAILLSCVAGMTAIMLIPADRKTLIRRVSAVFSGITLILSLWVFLSTTGALGGLQFVENAHVGPVARHNYFNGVDGFSLPNLLLTGIVFFTGRAHDVGTRKRG